MFNELIFEEGVTDLGAAYLGGGAWLPESLSWPLDGQARPMLHLACFPLSFISRYSDVKLAGNRLVSIFVPYSKADDDYIDEVMVRGGVVLIYPPAERLVSGGGEVIHPPGAINVSVNEGEDSEENGIAKVGGVPCWLQDEESDGGLHFALQINSSRLNKAAPSHKGILVGGVGVLLLGEQAGEVVGRFVVQTS